MLALAKFLHVLGAVLLLGNVIVTGLWAHLALGRKPATATDFATGAILLADLVFTLVGGALLTVAGLYLVITLGIPWQTAWLQHGAAALALATIVWLALLLPDQVRLRRLARAGDMTGLRRVYRRWALVGWADTAVLLYGLWVMVTKG